MVVSDMRFSFAPDYLGSIVSDMKKKTIVSENIYTGGA
jgi:hypothetical protein